MKNKGFSKSAKGRKMDESATVDSHPVNKKPAEKPVSLHPLKFEEAVGDLLRVTPSRNASKRPYSQPPKESQK